MNYSIVSETPSASLQEAKLYLRIDNNSEDALLESLIGAAQNYCREYVGRIAYTASIDISYDNWFGESCDYAGGYRNGLKLPFSTATGATVYYRDEAGIEQTISSTLYTVLDIDSVSFVIFKPTFEYWRRSQRTPQHLPLRITTTKDSNRCH